MTRSEFLELVRLNRVKQIYNLYNDPPDDGGGVEVDSLQRRNLGDGRPLYHTLEFTFPDGGEKIVVTLAGTYSSYDSTYWDEVYISEPYIHSETRYRKVENKETADGNTQ